MADYTYAQLEQIWEEAGGDPTMAPTMAAIAMAESGGNPGATNPTDNNGTQTSWGLWQISTGNHNAPAGNWDDPVENAKLAMAKLSSQGLSAWGTYDSGAYQQYMNGATTPATAQISGTDIGSTTGGAPLSMADIPAVKQYIQANYGSDAWLLSIPEVATILEQAVVNGDSETEIQALIQQTDWWKSTSTALKNYQEGVANNPADYNFGVTGSLAQQAFQTVVSMEGQIGISLPYNDVVGLATNYMQYGWNSAQLQAQLAQRMTLANAQGAAQQLVNTATGQYMVQLSPQTLLNWTQSIASGANNQANFTDYLKTVAMQKYPGMAQSIEAGNTPQTIVDPIRQEAANLMEVDPDTIDFINNPTYAKILNYRAPTTAGQQPSQPTVMTTSEMDQYLKATPQWGYTQQARDQAASIESTLLQTWGKVASPSATTGTGLGPNG